jgi:hypothetical protein
MRNLNSVFVLLMAVQYFAFSPLSLAESSPTVEFSPSVVAIQPGESCQKEAGSLKCRWDGECAPVGNTCRSCGTDQRYSYDLDKCYRCSDGSALIKNQNGQFVCPN